MGRVALRCIGGTLKKERKELFCNIRLLILEEEEEDSTFSECVLSDPLFLHPSKGKRLREKRLQHITAQRSIGAFIIGLSATERKRKEREKKEGLC